MFNEWTYSEYSHAIKKAREDRSRQVTLDTEACSQKSYINLMKWAAADGFQTIIYPQFNCVVISLS